MNNNQRTFIFSIFLFLQFVGSVVAQTPSKEVIGYYPSWKWRTMNPAMMPEHIPYEKLTMINYAFFYPLPDGRIAGRDSAGDDLLLKGKGRPPGTSLVPLAHRHGVKVLPSLGGWEESYNFPLVSADEQRRKKFAQSCLDLIREYDFDGIDVDWEYPGYVEHQGTPADKENFTKLLRIVKDSLSALGNRNGRTYLLTAALPAFADALTQYDTDSIAVILDMLNIMSYDFNGPWSPKSGHNSPLFSSDTIDDDRNFHGAFNLYHRTHRVPSKKINLGVPFYGHTYHPASAMFAGHRGTDTIHFSSSGAFYYDIINKTTAEHRRWDDKAKVPYLVIPEWNTVISYDDTMSVAHKARYCVTNNIGGVIIWEITGDYLHDGTSPLLQTISKIFSSASTMDSKGR